MHGIAFKKVNNSNDSVILTIRKSIPKDLQKLINTTNESVSYSDIYYEMNTGKNDALRKSNVLSIGDRFEYWIEYREDRTYKAIAGELEAINNNSIEVNYSGLIRPSSILVRQLYVVHLYMPKTYLFVF